MDMDREALLEAVRAQMPEKRWLHTLGVMETAVKLAKQYGADPVKADLAAILHDVCKFWPVEEQAAVIREHQNELPGDLLEYGKELMHAFAGAVIAREKYGVTDPEVLGAITYHTTGRQQMSLLEKVVCLADYIEPGRDFPGVNNIREKADHSLERALLAGFDGTIEHLLGKGLKVYPMTIAARNGLIDELRRNMNELTP